jgi:hypothetical protein
MTVSAAPAAAKSPCWSQVINDWYDNGRLDHDYAISCYQAALQHLPNDVKEYADAQDVIGRALQAAIAAKGRHASGGGGTGSKGKKGRNIGPVSSSKHNGGGPKGPNAVSNAGGEKPGLITRAFDRLGPGNANSIPIPLIVLGSLALLLLAAGAAGVVARKLQERRPQPATVPQTPNDGPTV